MQWDYSLHEYDFWFVFPIMISYSGGILLRYASSVATI